MCGIAGAYAYSPFADPVRREELLAVRESMRRRGPDGEGVWMGPDTRVGLVHRRLAILDLSPGGAQPMASHDGRLVITFNGEIYNFRALRDDLEHDGVVFRSTSDTEVLLALYERHGPAMVAMLRGMFAFAIWDTRARTLFLARDAFGVKPLYYADNGKAVRFASQVKALRKFGAVSADPEPAGHAGFFLWGFVPEPWTLFREIRALRAGTWMRWHADGRKEEHTYFDVRREIEAFPTSQFSGGAETALRIRDLMADSVAHHLVSDVPVGVFLSSGIDSSAVAALSAKSSPDRLAAFTMTLEGARHDESAAASRFALHYGLRHMSDSIGRDEFAAEIDACIDAMDQPSIDGVNTYFVSRSAARSGMRVALSGLGGDEIFGSYPSFQDVPRMARSIARVPGGSRLGGVARALTAPLIGAIGSPKLAGLLELGGSMAGAYLLRRGLYMPWELADVIDPELAHEGLKALSPLASLEATIPETPSAHLQVSALELAWYMRSQLLRDADWAGMAHGLEIRVPFVDLEIFRKVLPIAAAAGLRKRDALAACMSPEALAGLPTTKMGFEVPIRRWMEGHPGVTGERGLRGWARFVYARHFPRSPKYAAKRFAIFRIGHLGDAIVSMPAIAALRSANPDASLLLLTNEPPNGQMVSLGQVLGATGWFDQTIEYPTRGPWLVRALAIVRAIRKLRAFAPQVVYCLPPNRTRWQRMRDDWVFRRLAKAGRIIDAGIPESDLSGLQRQTRVTPEWKRFLDVVGMPPIEGFRLVLPEATRARAGEILAAHGLDPGAELVAVGPGSKMPAKVWPRERFVDVGRRILRSRRAHLLVLGGAEDKSLGDALCSAWGTRCTNLAGALKIDEALAVLSHCVLYVGNDTGTMHAAAIVGVPCVAIFSARDLPGLWEPYGDQHEILRANVDCAGCMLETCTQHGNKCLTAISVDEVEQAAHRRLPVQWVRIEAKQS